MTVADIVVTVVAALAGILISPYAARAIRDTPPDPEDDPPPVPSVGPWLENRKFLAPLLALVAAGVAAQTGAHWAVMAHVVAALGLVTLSVIDLDLFLLPKRIVWPTVGAIVALLAVAAVADGDANALKRGLVLCGFGGFGALLVLHIISPNGMGFGDVRLAGLIGLDLGWLGVRQVFLGIFAGFVVAAVVGLALIVARRKKGRDAVPFGPFLAFGTLCVLFGGDLLLGVARH